MKYDRSTLDETFTHQANGNLVSRTRLTGTFTYPAATAARPHAPTHLNGAAISYDGNGNMTSDGSRTLVWDEANRLKQVTAGGIVTAFAYGPDGARVKKSSSVSTTLFPTPDVEVKVTGSTPAIADFTRIPHPDIKIEGTVKQVLLRDHLASVRMDR